MDLGVPPALYYCRLWLQAREIDTCSSLVGPLLSGPVFSHWFIKKEIKKKKGNQYFFFNLKNIDRGRQMIGCFTAVSETPAACSKGSIITLLLLASSSY